MPSPLRIALLISLLPLTACGMLFNEEQRVVTIDSSPPGAWVELDGQRVGRTPVQVTVPTHQATSVLVNLPGHAAHVCTIEPSIEPIWVILDIWFLVPLVVDAVSGRWNDVPSHCIATFGRQGAPRLTPPPSDEPAPRPKPKDEKPKDEKPKDEKPKDEKPKPFPFPKPSNRELP